MSYDPADPFGDEDLDEHGCDRCNRPPGAAWELGPFDEPCACSAGQGADWELCHCPWGAL